MKILFIQPNGSGHPPLGLCYLAAALIKKGYKNTRIIDLNESSDSPVRSIDHLEKELKKKPDIVGITATTSTATDGIKIAKKTRPYCKTLIFGGPHATIFQEKILEKLPFIDIVSYGEADNTICELVERIEKGKSLKGINGVAYRNKNKIIKNDPNPPIPDLDTIPLPARQLLDAESYHAFSSILTSRGCPNMCTYCSNMVTGKRWRGRSPKNVVDEIEFILEKYPKIMKKLERNIIIADENFNVDKKRAKEICDEIIKRKLDISLTAVNGFHTRTVDRELMEKMKQAGCKEIWFGIESGNSKILKRMRKNTTKDIIRNTVKISKEAGISTVGGHFIIGLEDETFETAMDTVEFFKELKLDVGGFNQAIPLPGTQLWSYVEKNGRFLSDYDDVVDYHNLMFATKYPLFETNEFTQEERTQAYEIAISALDKTLRKRVLKPENIAKSLKSIKSPKDLLWKIKRFKHIFFGKDIRR